MITQYHKLRANQIARRAGFNRATHIVFGNHEKVISSKSCGYRKNSTGEYVSKSYRKNFGWKNTFYQSAECVVMLDVYNSNQDFKVIKVV